MQEILVSAKISRDGIRVRHKIIAISSKNRREISVTLFLKPFRRQCRYYALIEWYSAPAAGNALATNKRQTKQS